MSRSTLFDPIDLRIPARPGTLVRCCQLDTPGVYRLSRRDCAFHSIMISASGSFGQIVVRTGARRKIWAQPSSFTGSFGLDGFCEDGLIVEIHMQGRPFITVDWREPDREVV